MRIISTGWCWLWLALWGGGLASAAPVAELVARYELPPLELQALGKQPFSAAEVAQARTNGLKFDQLPSLGSGLARLGANEFVGLSDRGPNGEVGRRRTFPLPQFAPHLTRFRLNGDRIEILESIVLTDGAGKPLTGLSNQSPEERLFATAAAEQPLPYDPRGVDPEAVRVFPDGSYLLAEEYGPSLLVVSATGQVLMRYVPENKPLPGATYPVQANLPPILAERRTNRGFEALALSPDGRTAYVFLQSPLGDDQDETLKAARVVRVLRLDVSEPLAAQVTGHFLALQSAAAEYGPKQKQTGLKWNDADWLAADELMVLEQTAQGARLLRVDLKAAENLLGQPGAQTLAAERCSGMRAPLPARPARVELQADLRVLADASTKLEGLVVLAPTEVLVANDNDFGLGEGERAVPMQVWRLRMPTPARSGP